MTERVVRSFIHGNSASEDGLTSVKLDHEGTTALVGPDSAVYALRDGDITIRFVGWYSQHTANHRHSEALQTLDSYATMDAEDNPTTADVLAVEDGFLAEIGQQLRSDGLIAHTNDGP